MSVAVHFRHVALPQDHVTPPSIGKPTPPPAVSYRVTQLVHLPGGTPATPPYIGTPTPPLDFFCWFPQWVHLPGGAPATPLYLGMPIPPLAVSYWLPQLVHLPRGPLPWLPFAATPTPPPAVCYRRTQLLYLPGGCLNAPPYIGNAYAASDRLLPAHPIFMPLSEGPCHASLYQETYAASYHLLRAHLASPSPG